MGFEELNTIVEAAIAKLGLNPEEARAEQQGQWNIAKNEDSKRTVIGSFRCSHLFVLLVMKTTLTFLNFFSKRITGSAKLLLLSLKIMYF
jgi:hypothetical protein